MPATNIIPNGTDNVRNGLQLDPSTGILYVNYGSKGTDILINPSWADLNLVHKLGGLVETITGTKRFNNGVFSFGTVGGGNGALRDDAQLVASNLGASPGIHGLISIENHDPTDEAALTYYGVLSNGAGQQQIGIYSRFVNGINTVGAFNQTWGFHIPGVGHDNVPMQAYDNNAIWFNAGAVTKEQWNTLPPDNATVFGGYVLIGDGFADGSLVRTAGYSFEQRFGNFRVADFATNVGVEMGYSGGGSTAFLQSYDGSVFRPLSINASLLTILALTEFNNDVSIKKSIPTLYLEGTQASGRKYSFTSSIPGVANAGFTIRDETASSNVLVINASGQVELPIAPTNLNGVVRLTDLAVLDSTATPYTKSTINAAYPNAKIGFMVICDNAGATYVKKDNSSTGNWSTFPTVELT